LYEEIPAILWKKKEWTLYHKFKYTIRTQAMPILKECRICYCGVLLEKTYLARNSAAAASSFSTRDWI
jgi:hypothetical protein